LGLQDIQGLQTLDLASSNQGSGLPISEQAKIWYNYFSIESNQIKAKELLDPFRKENQKEFDFHLQEEYNLIFPTVSRINSIRYTTPLDDPFEDLEINEHLQDFRFIPNTETGEPIRNAFLRQYLGDRLKEYLALGGLKELLDRKPLILAEQKLPDPFYWDLWGNLEHLRESYQEWLAEDLFGPSSMELRSGTTTDGQNPRTPDERDPNIPEDIEITSQGVQVVNQGAQVQSPNQQQGQTPAAAQGVYVGGTYPATLMRATQGTPSYRPPQFAFTTPQARQSQEEYKSTKSHEDSDGSESTKPAPTPWRVFTFEAPMRPLDVARNMYLDYTTTQSIKFYNWTARDFYM
jgi:hypothetical protein